MVVDVKKQQLTLNKLICEKKETIVVQGDMIVPDSKPDILNTIDTSSIISIYKKEVMDGKVRLDGNINVYIMYLPDNSEDKLRGLNANLDFSESFIIPECTNMMKAVVESTVKLVECKVLNGRKINIKVTVETKVKLYESVDTDIICSVNDDNIQMMHPTYRINTLVGTGDNKVSVKENISIDNTHNLAEILKASINLVDKDIKTSYNKILAKAEAEVQIMYLTEDNKVNIVTSRLPVVGFIDIPGISEDNLCDTCFEIRNIIIKPNSIEEHSIYVEIELEVSCQAYEENDIEIVEDLYSICNKIAFNREAVKVMSNKTNRCETLSIREKVNVPEISDEKIINIEVIPILLKENKSNSNITCEGELNLNIIYTDNSSIGIGTKNIKLPFQFTIDNVNFEDNTMSDIQIEVASKDFILQAGGDISCNVDLKFNVNMYENRELNIIDEVTEEEESDPQDYSVIIYRVKKGDTLWKIAKEFKSTVDDIARVNGIEEPDRINEGEKLYIPKTVRVVSNYA